MNESTTKHLIVVLYVLAGILLAAAIIPFLYQYVAAVGSSSDVIPAFGNARILTALWLSLLSACVTTALALVFGVPLAQLLLLDEPLSNIDQATKLEVASELKKLFARIDIPALLVTHSHEDALFLAGRLAIMVEGKIEQVGSVREVMQSPKTDLIRRLLRPFGDGEASLAYRQTAPGSKPEESST